jgi:hypothetical protein
MIFRLPSVMIATVIVLSLLTVLVATDPSE